jgi:ribonuclease Y
MNVIQEFASQYAIVLLAAPVVALLGGILLYHFIHRSRMKRAGADASAIIDRAQREAETKKKEALLEVKDYRFQVQQELEKETRERRADLQNQERKLGKREDQLDKRIEAVDKRERELQTKHKEFNTQQQALTEKQERLTMIYEEQKEQLERISGMSVEQAKELLLEKVESDVRRDAAQIIKRVEEETKEHARKKGAGHFDYDLAEKSPRIKPPSSAYPPFPCPPTRSREESSVARAETSGPSSKSPGST